MILPLESSGSWKKAPRREKGAPPNNLFSLQNSVRPYSHCEHKVLRVESRNFSNAASRHDELPRVAASPLSSRSALLADRLLSLHWRPSPALLVEARDFGSVVQRARRDQQPVLSSQGGRRCRRGLVHCSRTEFLRSRCLSATLYGMPTLANGCSHSCFCRPAVARTRCDCLGRGFVYCIAQDAVPLRLGSVIADAGYASPSRATALLPTLPPAHQQHGAFRGESLGVATTWRYRCLRARRTESL